MEGKEILGAFAVAGLFLAAVFARAWKARGKLERRARVLEVAARAVARGLPLQPVFALAGLETVRAALDAGLPLCEALGRAPRLFPRAVREAVRAAQGTPGLAPALGASAAESAQSAGWRHRIALLVVYPLVAGAIFFFLQAVVQPCFTVTRQVFETDLGGNLQRWAGRLLAGIPIAAMAGFAVWGLGHRLRWWKGARLLDSSRMLRGLAALVGAGVPLPDALRRAGHATPRAERAAEDLEDGHAPLDAFDRLGLAPGLAARAATACGRGPAELAAALAALADECAFVRRARVERWLRWAQPLAVLAIGLVAALHFAALFQLTCGLQAEVGPW